MKDSASSVLDDEKAKEELETQQRHGEKVEGNDHLAVIGQEREPALAGIAAPPVCVVDIGRRCADLETELQQELDRTLGDRQGGPEGRQTNTLGVRVQGDDVIFTVNGTGVTRLSRSNFTPTECTRSESVTTRTWMWTK